MVGAGKMSTNWGTYHKPAGALPGGLAGSWRLYPPPDVDEHDRTDLNRRQHPAQRSIESIRATR